MKDDNIRTAKGGNPCGSRRVGNMRNEGGGGGGV